MHRVFAMAFLLLLTRAASAVPILHNGGFEQGNFTDWTLSGNTEYSQVFNQPYDGLSAHGGQDYALLGPQGADGILSQSFSDAAGQALTIRFWLASDGGMTDFFGASFDGTQLMHVTDTGAFGWSLYTAKVIGTGEDTLSFSFLDDQDYLALDGVRVVPAAPPSKSQGVRFQGPIPEPATLLLLPTALLLALAFRRGRPHDQAR